MAGLEDKLSHRVLHRLPHFERHFEMGAPYVRSFKAWDCRHWHAEFCGRIVATVGTGTHLPVYRISHGEFIMAVGHQFAKNVPLRTWLGQRVNALRRGLGMLPSFYSGSKDNTHETFKEGELATAQGIYQHALRRIAAEGILAIAFNENPGYEEYIGKYLRWMERERISLHAGNYMPFYSIYALLLGPESEGLFRNRRILIVTSFTAADKQANVEAALLARGAASVQCYPVSPTRAMFDVIDLAKIRRPVDVVLVGAGVGAASVLEQIRPLGAVALDAGFAIDAIAFPDKRWNRPFCIADGEFDIERIRFLDQRGVAVLRRLNAEQGRESPLLAQLEKRLQRPQAP